MPLGGPKARLLSLVGVAEFASLALLLRLPEMWKLVQALSPFLACVQMRKAGTEQIAIKIQSTRTKCVTIVLPGKPPQWTAFENRTMADATNRTMASPYSSTWMNVNPRPKGTTTPAPDTHFDEMCRSLPIPSVTDKTLPVTFRTTRKTHPTVFSNLAWNKQFTPDDDPVSRPIGSSNGSLAVSDPGYSHASPSHYIGLRGLRPSQPEDFRRVESL